MESKTYKGIVYTIQNLGHNQWKWAIKPPKSVQGLFAVDGTVYGSATKVTDVVKSQIDAQTGFGQSAPN